MMSGKRLGDFLQIFGAYKVEWVTCENVYDESWRRLLEYANIELAMEAIREIHGHDPKQEKNYKTKAEQVRFSLLQAKEYFEAARTSSLFTQPNHLYYGAVALSTACMVIRGDGKKSLDYLRKNSKSSHGLNFTFSASSNTSKQGFKLLENSRVEILQDGHFANWYSTLKKEQKTYGFVTETRGNNFGYSDLKSVGTSTIPDFNNILLNAKKHSLDTIIKTLPDLASDLVRYGMTVNAARGEHQMNLDHNNKRYESIFTFHGSPSHNALMAVVNGFKSDNLIPLIEIADGARSGVVSFSSDGKHSFTYPDSRETLDHRVIFYEDGLIKVPEVVDLFLISYALSMLSRYYPDIWVPFLESHCKGAKLVEQIVHVLTLKLTTLMLNQISNQHLIISNHKQSQPLSTYQII